MTLPAPLRSWRRTWRHRRPPPPSDRPRAPANGTLPGSPVPSGSSCPAPEDSRNSCSAPCYRRRRARRQRHAMPPASPPARAPVHRLGIHAQHDPVEGDKQRCRILANLLFRPQVRQEITRAILEAAPRLRRHSDKGTRRLAHAAKPDPGIRALARTRVGHEIKQQVGSRRRQAPLGQAEHSLGRKTPPRPPPDGR